MPEDLNLCRLIYIRQMRIRSRYRWKLMPALDTIEGLGDRAADAVVLAAEDGAFFIKR